MAPCNRTSLGLFIVRSKDGAALLRSVRKRFAFCLGRKPDDDHAKQVDQRDNRACAGVAAVKRGDELALGNSADGGEDAAEIVAQALARRPGPGGKQLGEIKREPAVKGCSAEAHQQGEAKECAREDCNRLKAFKNGAFRRFSTICSERYFPYFCHPFF